MADLYMIANIDLSEVPVNIVPLVDDTDFKTRETAIAYNAAGMDLVWNFTDAAGNTTQTAVTPTSGGAYDWTHQGDGMYTIEIPKTGGGSINNNQVGVGWFSGLVTGVLPWAGPRIEFVMGGEITSASSLTTTTFISSVFTGSQTDQRKDAWVRMMSGTNLGVVKKITAMNTSTGLLTFEAMPSACANGDKFIIVDGA